MELKCFEVIMPYRELKKYHKKYDIENLQINSNNLVDKLCSVLKTIFNTDNVYGGDFPSLGDYCYPAFIFNIEYKSGMENISSLIRHNTPNAIAELRLTPASQ